MNNSLEIKNVNKEIYDEYSYDNKELTKEQAFKKLENAIGTNEELIGYCNKYKSKGMLEIDFYGVKCIMPFAEISPLKDPETGRTHKGLCENKVGTNLKFRVLKYENDTFYISRKVIVEEQRKKASEEFKIGDVIEGKVTAINENLGCFVNIGADFTVLIPKKFLEYTFVEHISDYIKIGDIVTGQLVNIEKDENGIINNLLANRAVTLPSFAELASEFESGDVVPGQVTGISNKKIYVRLNKHICAVCRVKPNISVQVNDEVRVMINKIPVLGIYKVQGDIISKII